MPRAGLTKEIVIQKAAELANAQGLSAVTVTTLSEYLGIRKPSLYYHVASTDEVIEGIMVYGWQYVSRNLVERVTSEEPEEAIRQYAHEIYNFSINNPGVFEAMLWYNKYAKADLKDATEGLFNFFFIQTDKMNISRDIAHHLIRTFRAFLEGFIMLVIHNAFGSPIALEDSFEYSLDVMLKGIKQFVGTVE